MSFAATATLNDVPAVTVAGAETTRAVAWPALTWMVPDVPVRPPGSIPVIVCVPAVLRIADERVPEPFVTITVPRAAAWGSVLVSVTVPEYPVAGFPFMSRAVTVTGNASPALTAEGATIWNPAVGGGVLPGGANVICIVDVPLVSPGPEAVIV